MPYDGQREPTPDPTAYADDVSGVHAWEEPVMLPTYETGEPDKNPMFLEKRVYQGSSGVVYPHPVIEKVFDEKKMKEYTGLFLENEYLKVMLLPERGGRVQMALDKTNDYHFVYYNHVIKPALVGLCGPWISGGIEFNWPQHHRPSTFQPVDWRIEEHDDGSKTVWCSEIERMFRTKGMAGFRLHPERALLEVNAQLYNRTDEPQTFLWWANPAVAAGEEYRSVFPPDVHAVMDHGKRDVSDFPIAMGTYYKVDYSPGTDISRYKNIPVPTSYMAYHSDFDFMGCYDHGQEAGLMHVANHHVVPGKKQWTWGNGDFGHAWDRQLTDEDGPYVELMCGAFTDNQPDFAWIRPGEEKRFTQAFMPYKQTGPASKANRECVVSLDVQSGANDSTNGSANGSTAGDAVRLGVYVTRERPNLEVRLLRGGDVAYEATTDLTPAGAFNETVALDAAARPQELTVQVRSAEGELLIEHTPIPDETPEQPDPATAADPPEEIDSCEKLFLNGLHLEQYRHATYQPEPYYEEALRRDPGDSRCNTAMGRLLYQRGRFVEAEPYFRRATERATLRNPNPYDTEPFYQLGLALKMQGRYDAAYDAFFQAVWDEDWKAAGYFELARLACRGGEMEKALRLAGKTLHDAPHHQQVRHLRAALLRRLGRAGEATDEARRSLEDDPADIGALFEKHLLEVSESDERFPEGMRGDVHSCIELALDYAHAGLFDEAIRVLDHAPATDPMRDYFRGWFEQQRGDEEAAGECFDTAAARAPDHCFPNRIECVPALRAARQARPQDARAPYYLGNFWYGHRRYDEAIDAWEDARDLDPAFPTVHRNLGLAYMNKRGDEDAAREALETAFERDPTDARVFFELDQLRKECGDAPAARLEGLEAHLDLVEQRDDLMVEHVELLNQLGEPERAYDRLMGRTFHPWEGGEGAVTGQYVVSLVEQAKDAINDGSNDGDFEKAVRLLDDAQHYPNNLGEGKLYVAQENNIFYYLGCAHDGLGDEEEARRWFEKATVGEDEPTSAMYYNDQPPEMIFYQGLAWQKLGRPEEAEAVFRTLLDYGEEHLGDDVQMDYFAVSLPDFLVFDQDLNEGNRIHCRYMMGLGHLGLGDRAAAREHLDRALAMDPNHQGAALHRRMAADEGAASAERERVTV
jgi:tetratricopeptide (TPR) repeat protein